MPLSGFWPVILPLICLAAASGSSQAVLSASARQSFGPFAFASAVGGPELLAADGTFRLPMPTDEGLSRGKLDVLLGQGMGRYGRFPRRTMP